jgi:hypothetical protein
MMALKTIKPAGGNTLTGYHSLRVKETSKGFLNSSFQTEV